MTNKEKDNLHSNKEKDNDIVEVVDEIAFKTNLLSLNFNL